MGKMIQKVNKLEKQVFGDQTVDKVRNLLFAIPIHIVSYHHNARVCNIIVLG